MVGHAVAFDGGNGFIGGEVGFSPSSFFTAGYRNADDPGRAVPRHAARRPQWTVVTCG